MIAGKLWNVYARVYDGLLQFWPYDHLLNEVLQRARLQPGQRVLDLGCGTGNLTVRTLAVAGSTAVGVDAAGAMIAQARRKLAGPVAEGRCELVMDGALEFLRHQPDASFDRIVCVNVFYALDRRVEVWRELLRVLKPDGLAIITTPTMTGSNSIIREHIRHDHWWGLLRPRLIAVFVIDLLIDILGRRQVFAFPSQEELAMEAEQAGGQCRHFARAYGEVNTLFEVSQR